MRKFFTMALTILVAFSCVACSTGGNSVDNSQSGNKEYNITIVDPEEGFLPIVGDKVRKYLNADYESSAEIVKRSTVQNDDTQNSYIAFKTEYKNSFTVRYSTDKNFSTYVDKVVDKNLKNGTNYVNLGILYPNTTYYFRVFATGNPNYCSEDKELTTENSIVRPITLTDENGRGVRNVRDIGGWNISENSRVKYGLIYRGGYLNTRSGVNDVYALNDYGRSVMKDSLGIKSEIDLRSSGADDIDTTDPDKTPQTKNYIDSSLPYYKCTITQYDAIFTSSSSGESIKKIFKTLADKNNYPVYIHCNAGADRTGTTIGLIHALLGVSEEDLTRDFELTSYSPYGKRTRDYVMQNDYSNYVAWGKYLETLVNKYDATGKNLQVAAENYLKSLGITESEISAIKNIMIESM